MIMQEYMKILFHLNCLEKGGAERVITNLSGELARMGHDVIVATEWRGENEYVLSDAVKRVIVGPTADDLEKGRWRVALLRVTKLRDCIKKEKPDVVIAFTKKANYRAIMANWFGRVPTIIAVRVSPEAVYGNPVDQILYHLFYPRANGCVFQTEEQKAYFPKYLQKKSCIIFNPINEKYIGVRRSENPDKAIIHTSRVVDFKNQEMLLNAFLDFHKLHPDYEFRMYGGDSGDGTWQILESIIKENNAESFVHMMGDSDSLEVEVPKGEVYALSSNDEGMPNALLEAMAVGMPVVSTDCAGGGARTVIDNDKNGLIVPVNDREAMAKALDRLISDKEFAGRLGAEAAKIGTKMSCENIAKTWIEYIEKVIGA